MDRMLKFNCLKIEKSKTLAITTAFHEIKYTLTINNYEQHSLMCRCRNEEFGCNRRRTKYVCEVYVSIRRKNGQRYTLHRPSFPRF